MNNLDDLHAMIGLAYTALNDLSLSYKNGDHSDDLVKKYNLLRFAIDDAAVILAKANLEVYVQVPEEIRNMDCRRIFEEV